ncbi:hypothetical protein AHF37_09956 [Paragonimus kellicotti]|nr:hypothetical protein AHF37_09956 [Paragonimus kellicotti]
MMNRGHSLPGNKAMRRCVTFSSIRGTNKSDWNSAEKKLTQLFTPPTLNDSSKISTTCEQNDKRMVPTFGKLFSIFGGITFNNFFRCI